MTFTPAERRILTQAIELHTANEGDSKEARAARKQGVVIKSLNPHRFTLRENVTPEAVEKMKDRLQPAAKNLSRLGFIFIMLDASNMRLTGKIDFRAHITPAGYLAACEEPEAKAS